MRTTLTVARCLPLGLAGLCLCLPALAQYKVVGPDGKISYSDQPVSGATGSRLATAAAASPTSSLPLELRSAAGRYPVTLITGKDCRPCDAGRQLLVQRGVPFSEKLVVSANDATALRRLSDSSSLPLLTIGTQQLKGLTAAEWHSYLDAAGYPRESKLPATWRNPAPTPLAPAAQATSAPTPDAAPANESTLPPASDPAAPRIRF